MNLQKKRGFTIIELMVSIALGLLIIAGVSQVYLSNRNTFMIQEGLARLQENGRYANYILSKDLRMVGFTGCANVSNLRINNNITTPSYIQAFTNPLKGYDSPTTTFSPALPANIAGKALAGSDVIEIRNASFAGAFLTDDMHSLNDPVPLLPSSMKVNSGDPLLITDCKVGDLFIASSSNANGNILHTPIANTQNALSAAYTKSAQVMAFVYYAYYVKNTGRVNDRGQPVYALVRQNASGVEEEIAENVEKMRVMYAVDADVDKTPDTYQTATQVQNSNNWANVTGIEISLLLATPENVNAKPQSYVFRGVTTTPTDNKLRREWDTFVNLRNRGL